MTDELLAQAQNLKTRINAVNRLLSSLDLTDPSGKKPVTRTSPIGITAGMAPTVQFELVGGISKPTTIQKLDEDVYKKFVAILQSYKGELEKMFKDLN